MENEKKDVTKKITKAINYVIDVAKLSMLAVILVLVIKIYLRG